MQQSDYCLFLQRPYGAVGNRDCRRHSHRLTGQASFAEEMACFHQSDNRLFAPVRYNR
jgi:hypothetical protein